MHTLSVSALNEQIKTLLESTFERVFVEGELSRVTIHGSGHIYFSLKDDTSTIRAVVFKGNAQKLKFRLEEGLKVVIEGALSVYKPRGEYQINCFLINPAGQGALALAFEQLKRSLAAKGYFDEARKKQLPRFPKKIALITSATGAALQDMLRVANSRYKALEIDVYDVLVQGDTAALMIAKAIESADKLGYDIMVISRGGGSIEDLWAFNEEVVADAVFSANTPVISAVGHEIDWVISDFVADVRAPTPSAAMQTALPDTNELYQYMDALSIRYVQTFMHRLSSLSQKLEHLKNLYKQHSVDAKIAMQMQSIEQLHTSIEQSLLFKIRGFLKEKEYIAQRLPELIDTKINIARSQVLSMQKMLESNDPKLKSKKGFVQISVDSKMIDISCLEVGDIFDIMSDKIKVSAKVLKKNNIKRL